MLAVKIILIHLVVPVAGALGYLKIHRDMKVKAVRESPQIPIVILFFAWGGWLVLLLTVLFWYMSGMASAGYFVLLFLMPVAILGCIGWLYPRRNISAYHSYALTACYVYIAFLACVWAFLLPGILGKK